MSEQGSFALAELFKKLGIENDDVFVFDSVGRGTVPVLARAGLDVLMNFKKNRPFAKRFALLFERTQNILR